MTVSRALRQPDLVSGELRQRIKAAIDALGYVPDPAARALASGRTNVIGVIIPSVSNNVFSDVLRGIYAGIEHAPYSIQLANSRYSPEMEETNLRIFLSQRPAGLIIAGIDQSAASRDMLVAARCPVVQIMETGPAPIDMMVGFSHHKAACAATEHLLARGYRKLGFLGARLDPRTMRRYQGFKETAAEQGAFSEQRVVTTLQPSTVSLGAGMLQELLAKAPETDAIFCNNDDLALGALFEAQRSGIAVPEQLGICGFNDLEMAEAAEPSLTSVMTRRYDMGLRAIQMLLDRINARVTSPKFIDLGFELRPRRSTQRST